MKNKNTLIVGVLFVLIGIGLLVAGSLIPYLLTLGAALIVTGIIMISKGSRNGKMDSCKWFIYSKKQSDCRKMVEYKLKFGGCPLKKILFSLFLLPMLALSACTNDIQSIDLSQITFDGISIGDNFEQIETDKYTKKDNVSGRYNHNYEELRFSVDNGSIIEILASFNQVSISINGKEDCHSVDDIINTLGEDYNSSWYDKEQSLMQIRYSDKENGLQCVFVYDKNSNNLVWGIMQKVSV